MQSITQEQFNQIFREAIKNRKEKKKREANETSKEKEKTEFQSK